jgi:hypothetical protein
MGLEFRVDDVLCALEADDVIHSLTNDMGTLQSFSNYLKEENVDVIAKKIREEDEKKRLLHIKGLVKIYPWSDSILAKVMEEIKVDDMKENPMEWLQISDTLTTMVNKFWNLCSGNSFEGKLSDLQSDIEGLETKKRELENQRNSYSDLQNRNFNLRAEVDGLQKKCAELERQYSEEALNEEKAKLKAKIDKYKNEQEHPNRELENLKQTLEKYKEKKDNPELKKAIESFVKAVEKLPKDEEENY